MPNIAKILRDEMQRLARREVKMATAPLRKDTIALKHAVADQKRRVALLERDNKRLVRQTEKTAKGVSVRPGDDDVSKARITAKMIRSIRSRLGVSQADFAKLVGVSGQSVYQWERKPGRLSFRGDAKASVVRVRKLTKAEAKKQLGKIK